VDSVPLVFRIIAKVVELSISIVPLIAQEVHAFLIVDSVPLVFRIIAKVVAALTFIGPLIAPQVLQVWVLICHIIPIFKM
jgi:hypothetical protein